jgi:hypothetical protein
MVADEESEGESEGDQDDESDNLVSDLDAPVWTGPPIPTQ